MFTTELVYKADVSLAGRSYLICFAEGQSLGETGKAGELGVSVGQDGPATGGEPDYVRA